MKITKNPVLGTWEVAESEGRFEKRQLAIQRELVLCDDNRMLIVDDEAVVRKTFHKVLTMKIPDHLYSLVENGEEAVESFKEHHHCLVLMDLSMPVMNGEDAFLEIEKHCRAEKWEMPSVVFCTGYDPSGSLRSIVSDNAAHCMLRKPVGCQVLIDACTSRMVD